MNKKSTRILTALLFVVISFSSLSCASSMLFGAAVGAVESYDYTPEEKYDLGALAASNMLGTYKLYYNEELYDYLNSICQTLAIRGEGVFPYKGFHVGILDTDIINAFSTPGGHILLTRGLLRCTETEDELAAVIAHELSHVFLDHTVKAIQANNTREAASAFAGTATLVALGIISDGNMDDFGDALEVGTKMMNIADSITETIVDSGYSKDSEFKADKNAVHLMYKAGYNPHAMTSMLENLKKNSSKKYKMGFGKTHPSPKDRIFEVNYEISDKYEENFHEEARVERFQKYKVYF